MKNKNKIALYTALSAVALGLLGTGVASAGGMGMFGGGFGFVAAAPDEVASRHQTMFQNEATLLGISVDDVKSGWAEGKTIGEIATAHGITPHQLPPKKKRKEKMRGVVLWSNAYFFICAYQVFKRWNSFICFKLQTPASARGGAEARSC